MEDHQRQDSLQRQILFEDCTIHVGTKYNSYRELLAMFLHEILEIICVEQGVRSEKCMGHSDDCFVFVADHEEFSHVAAEASRIVADLMKLEK